MAISTGRTTSSCQHPKGFRHGKTSVYDQIALDPGKTCINNCSTSLTAVFGPAKPTRFYTGPGLCDTGASPILQDRLSRHNQNPGRTPENQGRSWPDQAAALYHPAKSTAQDAKKNIFQGLLGEIFSQA